MQKHLNESCNFVGMHLCTPKLFKHMQILNAYIFMMWPQTAKEEEKKRSRNKQFDFLVKITLGVFDHQICASYDSVWILGAQGDKTRSNL